MICRLAAASMLVVVFTIAGCKKDKTEGEDAAAEAAVAVVDAAPEAAASAAASVSAAPLPVVVKTAPKPPVRPDPPICVLARNARARNSPTVKDLEAQCKALGGTH